MHFSSVTICIIFWATQSANKSVTKKDILYKGIPLWRRCQRTPVSTVNASRCVDTTQSRTVGPSTVFQPPMLSQGGLRTYHVQLPVIPILPPWADLIFLPPELSAMQPVYRSAAHKLNPSSPAGSQEQKVAVAQRPSSAVVLETGSYGAAEQVPSPSLPRERH